MIAHAMVMTGFNEPLTPRDIEVMSPDEGEILVRIDAAGVCGSDIHMWKGEDPRIPLPIIPGHEGVGTVADIGGRRQTVDGRTLAPGDRIIWNRGISCGHCWYCAVLHDPSLCERRSVYGITMSASEPPYLNGCYASHIVLRPGTDVFIVPGSVDPAVLVPASCSGATAAHAFAMLREPLVGRTVVVQGPGPLGVFAVAFARSMGAADIIVVGGTRARLELCREFGATRLIDRHTLTVDERREAVFDYTCGRGADVVVEAVGARGVASEGIRMLRKGGVYLTTGYAQPVGEDALDFYRDVVARNVEIRGVWVSDTGHLRQAADLVLGDVDRFESLVTHRFPLGEADEALRLMDERTALKAVLTT